VSILFSSTPRNTTFAARLPRQVAAWQQPYDAWITPVLATPPQKIGTVNYDEIDLMKIIV